MKEKNIAILFSGHLRNILKHVENLKKNLLKVLENNSFKYDIYIHTWDNNLSNDKIANHDKFYTQNIENTLNELNKHINIKKILIENQDDIYAKKDINNKIKYLIKNKTFHGKKDTYYVYNLTLKLYYQYYGQYKSYKLIENIDNYDYIIKTRPDAYYFDTFDVNIFNNDIIFPNSHLWSGKSINSLFYLGKTKIMKKILEFFNYIYDNEKYLDLIDKYNCQDINFNQLFRFYIINYMMITPYFSKYNPGIFRNEKLIVKIN